MISPGIQNNNSGLDFQWDPQVLRSEIPVPIKDGKRDLDEIFIFLDNFQRKNNAPELKHAVPDTRFVLY